MNRVEIEPRLVRWAIERAGLKPSDLIKKFPKVLDWATGDAAPTLRQLEDLATATRTPVGYFFLPEPPEEELPVTDFRTMAGADAPRPSPDLLETVYLMERRQEFMREFLIEEGHEPLEFVGMAAAKGEPTVVADLMRRALGLPPDWSRINPTWTRALSYLREASESAGVLVVINGIVGNNTRRKLDPEEFRGFALVDPYAPLVFVNGADAKAAQIFSLAHELAHIVTGEPGVSGLPNLRPTDHKVEVFCNAVAAEFLVPAAQMETVWDSARENERPFEVVARHFKVSALVAARRAYDLGYISHEEYSIVFNREVSEERKKKPGGGDFWVNQNQRVGRRFGRALVQAAREGRLLYQSAYELSGLFGGTFEKYADRVAPREAR